MTARISLIPGKCAVIDRTYSKVVALRRIFPIVLVGDSNGVSFSMFRRGFQCREREENGGASAQGAFRPHASAMPVDDPLDDGQAQARSFEFIYRV
jgi:hypothetical protein